MLVSCSQKETETDFKHTHSGEATGEEWEGWIVGTPMHLPLGPPVGWSKPDTPYFHTGSPGAIRVPIPHPITPYYETPGFAIGHVACGSAGHLIADCIGRLRG